MDIAFIVVGIEIDYEEFTKIITEVVKKTMIL